MVNIQKKGVRAAGKLPVESFKTLQTHDPLSLEDDFYSILNSVLGDFKATISEAFDCALLRTGLGSVSNIFENSRAVEKLKFSAEYYFCTHQ
jgi:hypothetical protein